jgi:hypothetical protein
MPFSKIGSKSRNRSSIFVLSVAIACLLSSQTSLAQEELGGTKPVVVLPEIKDNPVFVDGAQFMSKGLAQQATVNFEKSTLEEVVTWLSEQQDLPVVINLKNDSEDAVVLDPSEIFVSDRLNNQPIYWFLNRLKSAGIYWFVEDDILYLTTEATAQKKLQTQSYTLGDLLDAGFSKQAVIITLESCFEPRSWESAGGVASLQWLGDVLFVRQNYEGQLMVASTLAALKDHGRRTWINESVFDQAIRKQWNASVTLSFNQQPLSKVVQSLAETSQVDIRLDYQSLADDKIRDKTLVSLNVANRSVTSALDLLVLELNAAWIYENGVVWVVGRDSVNRRRKVAVMDVRDLCRDAGESGALGQAIESQSNGDHWESRGGVGAIRFPRSGTMSIAGTERMIIEVEKLLISYRKALLASKPRGDSTENELVQEFYVVQSELAKTLVELLPILVEPTSWKTESRPEAPGTVLVFATEPALLQPPSNPAPSKAGPENRTENTLYLSEQSVVIVMQKRSTHEKIVRLIRQLKGQENPLNNSSYGTAPMAHGIMGGMGMGGGMGAAQSGTFGGGMF